MAEHGPRHPGYVSLQNRQCSRIILEHEMGRSHQQGGPLRVEWIEPHVGIKHLYRTPRISREEESQAKTPVNVVWVKSDGSFELGYGSAVLAHPCEDKTEHRTRFG